jgi:RimJ/RimL family protein N-acetyltransferase
MKISGKFIYLKKIKTSDALFTYNLRLIKSNKLYLHNPPKSIKDQKKWIINNIKDKTSLDFVIYNITNDRKIGTIAFNNITKKNAEWGRWISVGNSIQNIESVLVMLSYGFKKLKFKEIYSLTNVNNKKVVNFHSKSFAKYKGLIKSKFFIKNKKTDAVNYEFNLTRLKHLKSKFKIMTQLTQ